MNLINSKNTFIAILLSFIYFTYSLKYLSRFIDDFFFLSAVFSFLYFLIIFLPLLFNAAETNTNTLTNLLKAITFIFLILISFFSLVSIDNRLAREKAIIEWIDSLFYGIFPYGNDTKTNPSVLPFLMFLYIPFRIINAIGIINIIATLLFTIITYKYFRNTNIITAAFLAIIFHPFIYYESLLKSDLFFNTVLFITLIYLSETKFNLNTKKNFYFYLTSALWGFLLSGRLIFILIYVLYISYKFKNNFSLAMPYTLTSMFAFFLTIAPFLYWNFYKFLNEGPFAIQSIYSNKLIVLFFIIVSSFTGYYIKNIRHFYFTAGTLLFSIVFFGYFLPNLIVKGYEYIFFRDGYDITYFNFCVPFLILGFANEVKNFE